MKRKLLARLSVLVFLSAAPLSTAVSGELSAVINGKAFHLNAERDWNEANIGAGVEFRFAADSRWKTLVMANGFRDSSNRMSYMAGGGLHRNLFSVDRLDGLYLDVGINAFMMTREDVNGNRPFPGALPSLTIGNRIMGFNVAYLPKTAVEKIYDAHMKDESMTGILFVQFKVNLSQLLAADRRAIS